MSTEQNAQIAKDFLMAVASYDSDRVASLMADDGVYWVLGKPHLFPDAGEKSKSKLCELLKLPSPFKDGLSMKVHTVIAEGSRVALEAESNGIAPNGKTYNNQYVFLFNIRDGKVVSAREYQDLLHAADVFGF